MRTAAETMHAPKRCAIYTRKSTAAGLEQDFNSLDAQREACEQYIASRVHAGWWLMPERYDDGGFTGANLERPAFQKLLQDIDAGKIDLVIVYKVDRLSRSLLDFAQVMRRFDQAGVSFVSVTHNFSTADAMGRLTLNMLMSFAEFEREMIAERTRDKMAAARKAGQVGWRPRATRLSRGRRQAPDPRGRGGPGARDLPRLPGGEVTRRHARCPECAWLADEEVRYQGRQVHRRSPLGQGPRPRQLTNQVYVGKVDFQGQIYEGEHEAIIDEDTFARVQQLLKNQAPDASAPLSSYQSVGTDPER